MRVAGVPTGRCVALVLGSERCLCADIGAAGTCPPDHVFPTLDPARRDGMLHATLFLPECDNEAGFNRLINDGNYSFIHIKKLEETS